MRTIIWENTKTFGYFYEGTVSKKLWTLNVEN